MDNLFYLIAIFGTVALVVIIFNFIKIVVKQDNEDEKYVNRLRKAPAGQSTSYEYRNDEKVNGAKFRLRVEDVFSITGRGTVVTGKTELGPIKKGDEVVILQPDGTVIDTKISGIEQFRKMLDYADPDTNVGLLLEDVDKKDVMKDSLVVKF